MQTRFKKTFNPLLIFLPLIIFGGCGNIPNDVEAVSQFDLEKYTGTWYEIARMDSRFEKGLVNVTATYTPQENGNIEVINRGMDTLENKWNEIKGKARVADDDKDSMLEVSFFGPFYAGYNVINIADDYSYALVCGNSRDYLWILSREKRLSQSTITELISQASELGFDTSALVLVPQNE